MNEILWRLILLLQRNRVGRIFVRILYSSKLVTVYNFYLLEYERKNPTAQMQYAKNFWHRGGVQKRMKRCCALLYDNLSKETYKRVIQFRITHDYRHRPLYDRKSQYFPKDIIHLDSEVFIDCGAYNGDTVEQFLKRSKNRYKKIVAFEPDEKNLKSLKKMAKQIVVENAAVWNCDTTISFEDGNGSGSKLNEAADRICTVQARAIDNIKECQDASFIKMDIEGSEYEALQGAYHVICTNKPKLAICIYHSEEDMLRILELISSWNLGYRFYIRHHGQKISETVLYAVQ